MPELRREAASGRIPKEFDSPVMRTMTVIDSLRSDSLEDFKGYVKHNSLFDMHKPFQTSTGERTLLELAMSHDRDDIGEWLVKEGTDPAKMTLLEGVTPLSLAIRHKLPKTFVALLKLEQEDINGLVSTPLPKIRFCSLLTLALERGMTDSALALIKGGADILPTLELYTDPERLERSAQFKQHCQEQIKILKSLNVGFSPLLCKLAQKDKSASISFLMTCGISIDEKGSKDFTPLMFSAAYGYSHAVETLNRLGAKVNCSDASGSTPLIWACRKGHSSIAELLIKLDADVTAENDKKMVAAFYALEKGPVSLAEKLVDKTYLDIKDYQRGREFIESAYRHAKKSKDQELMVRLVEAYDFEAVD